MKYSPVVDDDTIIPVFNDGIVAGTVMYDINVNGENGHDVHFSANSIIKVRDMLFNYYYLDLWKTK